MPSLSPPLTQSHEQASKKESIPSLLNISSISSLKFEVEKLIRLSSGGSNLRVGFVELLGTETTAGQSSVSSGDGVSSRIQNHLERSWHIDDSLKNRNAESLFHWIGSCIAEVVRSGCEQFSLSADKPLPLGVTFSFPMEQISLSEATLMSMGKGFAVEANTELGSRLLAGYNSAKAEDLPPIVVTAIANDSVSTLVSFILKFDKSGHRRASMGLILGTGCNATIPLRLNQLHPSKQPQRVNVLPGENVDDVKITVNTEWSIKGSAPPLRELGWISRWDEVLDSQTEVPGFQPLEYMTAGRYLGELGRIVLVDYLTTVAGIPEHSLPTNLLLRHTMTTTFLSHFRPLNPAELVPKLQEAFPEATGGPSFHWTEDLAAAVYHIAKAIEVRGAGIVSAAIMALLTLGEELPSDTPIPGAGIQELGVGYTGGCIVHFQDYLSDCQDFINKLVAKRYGEGSSPVRVVLSPCHDGGVTGAGILVAAASESQSAAM